MLFNNSQVFGGRFKVKVTVNLFMVFHNCSGALFKLNYPKLYLKEVILDFSLQQLNLSWN